MLNHLGFYSSWALKILQNFWLRIVLAFKKYQHLENNYQRNCPNKNINRKSTAVAADEISNGQQLLDIPKAKGLPVFGTFFDLIAAGAAPKLHKYIDKRHQQLGPIFGERLCGTQEAVFVSSASLMRAVFLFEGQYPRHPLPDAWTLYNKEHQCQRGLFFMEGAEWLHNRRLLSRVLLNGNIDWMNVHIEECTEKLVSKWKIQAQEAQQSGTSYTEIENLEQQLYRWAIDVVCTIMFGSSVSASVQIESALDDFSQIVRKVFENSALLMNFPPKLAKFLNMKIWSEFEQNVAEVLDKGSEVIDLFIAQAGSSVDVEEPAVNSEDSAALFSKLQGADMSLPMIKRIFVDLVIAAGDTTAFSTEWTLYLLSQNPELQHQIAKGVPLVRGLIKEALRLYPVAPFIGRYLDRDANIGGYHIKKDTLVLLSLYTAGRDAAHFPNPLTVKPERWDCNEQTRELREVTQAHGTLPFAIGNRSCIGRKVATNQMHSIVTAIARNFELKCTNTEPIDCVLRLVTVPNQTLQLAIKLREIV